MSRLASWAALLSRFPLCGGSWGRRWGLLPLGAGASGSCLLASCSGSRCVPFPACVQTVLPPLSDRYGKPWMPRCRLCRTC